MKKLNKKAVTGLVIAGILMTNITVFAAGRYVQAWEDDTLKIKFNNQVQSFTDTSDGSKIVPLIYNGRTYLPVRAVSTLTGLGVDYDSTTRSVLLTSNGSNGQDPYKDSQTYQNNTPTNIPPTTSIPTTPITPTTNTTNTTNIDEYYNKYSKIQLGDTYEQVKAVMGSAGEKKSYGYNWTFKESYITVFMPSSKNTVTNKQIYYHFNDRSGLRDNKVNLSELKSVTSQMNSGIVFTYNEIAQKFGTPGISTKASIYGGSSYLWVDADGSYADVSFDKDGKSVSIIGMKK